MNNRSRSTNKLQATSFRTTIKSVVAQLDNWDKDLIAQRKKREANNLQFASFEDRLRIAKYQAKLAFPSKPGDPLCDNCESPFHSSDHCDILDTLNSVRALDILESVEVEAHHPNTSTEEDPQVGIHRGIIHRLYLATCSLYRLQHPRFYPGPQERVEPSQVFPVPLTGPDYLRLAISQAAEDYQALPSVSPSTIRQANLHSCSVVGHLYYSKAFPLTFTDFCDRVADCVAAAEAEAEDDPDSDHSL
jgi:hypothetical protein